MAFCKFCGKEIADGAVCSCQAAQAQAPAPAPTPQAAGGFDPVFGQPAQAEANNGGKTGSSDPLKLLIAGVAAVLVLIIVLVFVANHTGAKGLAKKYTKKIFNKHGGKSYYSMILADDVYKEVKKDGDLEDYIDDYNDRMSDLLDEVKIKPKNLKKTKKLSKKQLTGAEVAFAKQNKSFDKSVSADDYKAKKGYEFKFTYKIKDKDSGDTETVKDKFCVVKFKKHGWKIIKADADTLKSYGESASKNKDKNKDKDYDDYDDLFDF